MVSKIAKLIGAIMICSSISGCVVLENGGCCPQRGYMQEYYDGYINCYYEQPYNPCAYYYFPFYYENYFSYPNDRFSLELEGYCNRCH